MIEARRVVECGCVAAALRDPALPATLNELLEQQTNAVGTERFTELDAAFHTAIVEAAGNSLLSSFYSGLMRPRSSSWVSSKPTYRHIATHSCSAGSIA